MRQWIERETPLLAGMIATLLLIAFAAIESTPLNFEGVLAILAPTLVPLGIDIEQIWRKHHPRNANGDSQPPAA